MGKARFTLGTNSLALCLVYFVTYASKGRVPNRSTGSVEQPIEILSELTNYKSIYPIALLLVDTLELTLQLKL